MPTISVVIPTYNRAALLKRALDSVAKQTYSPHEILVVDDGSTDDTKAIVDDYIRNEKPLVLPIRYIYQKQQGAPTARNTGVAAAAGDWIAFLDSDDRWLPKKLDYQVRALNEFASMSAACVTDAWYVNNPALKLSAFQQAGMHCDACMGLWPEVVKRIAYGYHGMYLQTLMVSRKLILEIGGFDPLLPLGDDTDILFYLAKRTSISYVNMPLVEIDRTPDRSNGLIELFRKERFRLEISQRLYEKWLSKPPALDFQIRKRVLWRLQEIHTGWSSWYLINHQYNEALAALSQALHYNVTAKVVCKWLLTRSAPALARKIVLRHRENSESEILF